MSSPCRSTACDLAQALSSSSGLSFCLCKVGSQLLKADDGDGIGKDLELASDEPMEVSALAVCRAMPKVRE